MSVGTSLPSLVSEALALTHLIRLCPHTPHSPSPSHTSFAFSPSHTSSTHGLTRPCQNPGKWHLGYPALSISAADRERIVATPASGWRNVKGQVLSQYHAIQQHVRRCGFDVVERLYVNNLYPEQHVLPAAMLMHMRYDV